MDSTKNTILVSAPTKAGKRFVQLLKLKGLPFAVIANSKEEQKKLAKITIEPVLLVNTAAQETWHKPDFPVGAVYLFQNSLPLVCRYLQIVRSWTTEAVYVITEDFTPRSIYRGLGADYVVYTKTGSVGFLIS